MIVGDFDFSRKEDYEKHAAETKTFDRLSFAAYSHDIVVESM